MSPARRRPKSFRALVVHRREQVTLDDFSKCLKARVLKPRFVSKPNSRRYGIICPARAKTPLYDAVYSGRANPSSLTPMLLGAVKHASAVPCDVRTHRSAPYCYKMLYCSVLDDRRRHRCRRSLRLPSTKQPPTTINCLTCFAPFLPRPPRHPPSPSLVNDCICFFC